MADLLFRLNRFSAAVELIKTLTAEVKKLDDKLLLVEIFLTDSRVQHALSNKNKAKSALTAARTNANAVYIPVTLQSQIDIQGGVLNATEGDFTTAFSYFFEAFEAFDNMKGHSAEASMCLKYMLLCKIMGGDPDAVPSIASGKTNIKYAGEGVSAMKAVASALKKRSLVQFQAAIDSFANELQNDRMIAEHLNSLYETMLEQNLLRIVEPYSRVEIARVAELISMPLARVETKLSQMILDKKLAAILDQGEGHLILFDSIEEDPTYSSALKTISALDSVVSALFKRAEVLKTKDVSTGDGDGDGAAEEAKTK